MASIVELSTDPSLDSSLENISLTFLFIILFILILLSGFFSAAETSMMAINRYRLRHLVRAKNIAAIRVNTLLERTDRLLGIILIGSTFANILASAIATIIAAHLYGGLGIAIATILLTIVILIFSEIAPKTLSAMYPEPIAFRASWSLTVLLKVLYPIVWFANIIIHGMFRLFRVKIRKGVIEQLTREELSTLVAEAGDTIPDQHQEMLLAILSLEKITVDDVMVPRNDITGIDLTEDWDKILEQLRNSQHSHLPIYFDDINNVKGVLRVRIALKLHAENKLTKENLLEICEDPYFIPEGAPLPTQLLQFRAMKQRVGLVVDEYGDVIGMVTLADMLEEIVGEFATNITTAYKEVQTQPDGSFLVLGGINIRDLNRIMGWEFDISGPKTLSGLITEYLETIPQPGVCLRLSGYPVEIIKVTGNTVKLARVMPGLRRVEG
jgi:Mg2+/Co2+ transporter CorB